MSHQSKHIDSDQTTLPMTVTPWVDGSYQDSNSDEWVEAVNPYTEKPLFSFSAGTEGDIQRAVQSSRVAFDDGRWSKASPSTRKTVLLAFADLIEQEAPALDALDAEEMGRPVSIGLANAAASAGLLRYCAEAIDKLVGDVYPSDKHSYVAQRWVPHGVVGAIVPWNFPTFNAVLKAAPVLAAGNTLVMKPSELASRSAIRLAQLAMEAGLPAGVFNVVPGLGHTVGKALALHQSVNQLTFTGSSHVGKLMMQYAGQSNLKPVIAECGGKSPQLVFDDGVDLDTAARCIAGLILTNQGQLCSTGSRVLVQRSIESRLIEKLHHYMLDILAGDPLDKNTSFGPLSSRQQQLKVLDYIQTGVREGGERIIAADAYRMPEQGFFVAPAIISNVEPTATIAQQEIFGPVLSITAFDSVDEAIALANATAYGLAAYAWTDNLDTSMRLADSIHSGITINSGEPLGEGAGFAISHEPYGLSGIGVEGGLAGIKSYLRSQYIAINHR